MKEPSDTEHCKDCGKQLKAHEKLYVFKDANYRCMDCLISYRNNKQNNKPKNDN